MNAISIRGDLILLHWDRVIPPGFKPDKMEIEDVPYFWEHLKGHARFSKRSQDFMLDFSKQNIRRLHAQFGPIPVRAGMEQLRALKERQERFTSVVQKAVKIKEMPYEQLPQYNYKVPPKGPYQHRGVVFLKNIPYAPLFADCGVGKTFMVLVSTELQLQDRLIRKGRTLVAGKLNTLFTGWQDDCAQFTDLKTKVLWVPQNKKVSGAERRARIVDMLGDSDADIFVINHEGLILLQDSLAEHGFDKVVVDESTILKGFHGTDPRITGGQFGRALLRISAQAKYRVVMSGTPSPNGPWDLWGQFAFLDEDGFTLEPSYNDFRAEYYTEVKLGKRMKGRQQAKYIMKKDSPERVSDLTSPLAYRVRARDVLPDMPPITPIVRKVVMGERQMAHYQSMKEDLKVIINDKRISIQVRLAQLGKLRQLSGGFIIDQQEEANALEDNAKMEEMDSLLCDEIDDTLKVVVFAQYQWEIKTLAERYKHFGVVTCYGGNSSETNLTNITRFKTDPSTRLIFLHPKSAAHGITFTESHYMIFYSIDHSAENNYQAKKRIDRIGQKHPMFVFYLLAQGTVDIPTYKAVGDKDEIQQQTIDRDLLECWDSG